MSTPLGQWCWALSEAHRAHSHEGPKEMRLRLHELQRFAAKQWPGWYENTLNAVVGITSSHASTLLSKLQEHAGAVAAYDAFRELLHGARDDVLNHGGGPTLAALRMFRQGTLSFAQVRTLLQQLPDPTWWRRLQAAARQSLSTLQGVEQGGFTPDTVLLGRDNTLAASFAVFSDFCEQWLVEQGRGQDPSSSVVANACSAFQESLRVLKEIAAERGALRQRIQNVAFQQ